MSEPHDGDGEADERSLEISIEAFVRDAGPEAARALAAELAALGESGEEGELAAGFVLSHYRIVRRIGSGGMGVVYEAMQEAPVVRTVAIKLIRPGRGGAALYERFASEQATLARLEHPNIARVYDAGLTPDGRPFFAMERVDGVPLLERLDAEKTPLRRRIAIFLEACAAVEHAHQKSVVHLDLKPGNVLAARLDGRTVPKIIDFGLARLLSGANAGAAPGSRSGTPEYMSPEQGRGDDVDTRSDVFALGVLLHELLTGVLPQARQSEVGGAATPRIVPPSSRVAAGERRIEAGLAARATTRRQLARDLEGDLDWILQRALERDRGRRYATVSEFAADLRRHLADLPVSAAPADARYWLGKFVRRHRRPVAAGAAFVTLLLAALVATTALWARAERLRDEADAARSRAVAVRDYLEALLTSTTRNEYDDPEPTLTAIVTVEETEIVRRFAGEPFDEGLVRRLLGKILLRSRRFDRAADQFTIALERLRGERPTDLTEFEVEAARKAEYDAVFGLCNAKVALGDPALARSIAEDALARGLAITIDERAQLHRLVATLLALEGDAGEAERRLRDLLDAPVPGIDPMSVVATIEALARVYLEQGRDAEALALCERALPVLDRLPARRVGMMKVLLGTALSRVGRREEAETMLLAAHRILADTLREHHPRAREAAAALAGFYRERGDEPAATAWESKAAVR
jgi:tetratricopeptide (TPR) repeat protein